MTFQFLGLGPAPLYVANFAITDLDRKTFSYQARSASQPAPTKKDGFALHTGDWSMSGGSGTDVFKAALPNYSLDLRLQTTEPAVLDLAGLHDLLLDALRRWRTEACEDKPAYTVAHNSTLAAIAAQRPGSLTELEAIRGVGPTFVERHGERLALARKLFARRPGGRELRV